MKSTLLCTGVLAIVLGGCNGPCKVPADGAQCDNATPLFNGTSLAGWWGESTTDPRSYIDLSPTEFADRVNSSQGDIHAHWRVEVIDSVPELVNDGDGLYLTTIRFYEDFDLSLEYKTVAGADSGVYLRGVPQVQIWDTTEAGGKWNIGADKGSGGLWNNSADDAGGSGKDPLVHADNPFGEWNTLRVRMVGQIVSVWLNGKLVVDAARLENYYDRSIEVPTRGPIQLQTHGGEIRWRNITIRELNAE